MLTLEDFHDLFERALFLLVQLGYDGTLLLPFRAGDASTGSATREAHIGVIRVTGSGSAPDGEDARGSHYSIAGLLDDGSLLLFRRGEIGKAD
jgi:hypothetical protein